MFNTKNFVAMTSIVASGCMTVLKLAVGLATGSLGLLSEAIHSLLDLTSASMTFFAVRAADKPADSRHPYGHGKIEALSALFSTVLLVATSLWIMVEAVHRLANPVAEVAAPWYSIALIVVVIVVDIGRSRALMRVARETGSQALAADALHYTSDILSSFAVLLGLGLVAIGWPRGDAVAALVVACVVLFAAWHLGRTAFDVLIDTAPEGVVDQVTAAAAGCDGVVAVEEVRARQAGTVVFVELLVRISRSLTLERAEAIRRAILARLRDLDAHIDARVTTKPLTLSDESVAETVRALAAERGLGVHKILLRVSSGRTYLSFDVEMDENLTMHVAHDAASELEEALKRDLGADVVIDTHIDPRPSPAATVGRQLEGDELRRFERIVRGVADATPYAHGIHHLEVGEGPDGHHIAFHCLLDAEMPLHDAHAVAAVMEHRIEQAVGGPARVIVHAEPDHHFDGN